MKIKLYKCECVHCVFPFGNGMPVCIREMEQTKNFKSIKNCVEKGCLHYEKFISSKDTETVN